jgi:hypothetical protein
LSSPDGIAEAEAAGKAEAEADVGRPLNGDDGDLDLFTGGPLPPAAPAPLSILPLSVGRRLSYGRALDSGASPRKAKNNPSDFINPFFSGSRN